MKLERSAKDYNKWNLLLLMIIVMVSCKKENEGKHVPPTPIIKAAFSAESHCINLLLLEPNQFLDSTIYFVNQSDTGQKVSYKWDFGDNAFTTQQNPVHTYSLPGNYKVRLITFFDKVPSDTAEENITSLIGQYEFNNGKDIRVIDGAMTADNGVLAVVAEYDYINYRYGYSLLCTDSLLKLKWLKDIGNTSRISSIQQTSTNEYMISGNFLTGNKNQFAVSKLNSEGEHVWTKFIANLLGSNISTIETTDKGFITIGYSGTPVGYVAIVKLDINGNEVWRRLFNNASAGNNLIGASNMVENNNNYIFAAFNDNHSHLVITSLDATGNLIKQQKVLLSSNLNAVFSVGIAKTSAGYLVNRVNNSIAYLFNNELYPTGSIILGKYAINELMSWNNSYYACERDDQSSVVRKLDTTGTTVWGYGIAWQNRISCNLAGSAYRDCRKVIKGLNDFITLSDGEGISNSIYKNSIFIERITPDGKMR